MLREIFLVGMGGFLGSIGRYGVAVLCNASGGVFPLATLIVNVVGCLCIGFAMTWIQTSNTPTNSIQLFFVVGILGGFTTFSTFGYQTVQLLKDGNISFAALNVLAHTTVCLCAVVAGSWIASR